MTTQGTASRPSILLVMVEGLRADDLSRPALRAFQQESLTFTNAFCCGPEPGPARASVLTGLDMAVHRVWTDGDALAPQDPTLSQVFASQGYHSFAPGQRNERPFFGVVDVADGGSDMLETILSNATEDTIIVVTGLPGGVEAEAEAVSVKVPLMIRVPGREAGEVSGIVSTMDIAPTLFELAGVVPPRAVQGQSLLSRAPRGWALSRVRHVEHAEQTVFISETWKLILTHDASEALALYDLASDPAETRNLATQPEHIDQLEAMLDLMIDARVALEDRREPRVAKF